MPAGISIDVMCFPANAPALIEETPDDGITMCSSLPKYVMIALPRTIKSPIFSPLKLVPANDIPVTISNFSGLNVTLYKFAQPLKALFAISILSANDTSTNSKIARLPANAFSSIFVTPSPNVIDVTPLFVKFDAIVSVIVPSGAFSNTNFSKVRFFKTACMSGFVASITLKSSVN